MSEFGDGTFTQEVLNMVKCAMTDPNSEAEQFRVIKAFHEISSYWLEDMEFPSKNTDDG